MWPGPRMACVKTVGDAGTLAHARSRDMELPPLPGIGLSAPRWRGELPVGHQAVHDEVPYDFAEQPGASRERGFAVRQTVDIELAQR